MTLPERTESVCPVCLRPLEALLVAEGDEVFLRKSCPEHGDFSCVVWRGLSSWESWKSSKVSLSPEAGRNAACPRACGLCAFHGQTTCAVVLEVTSRCPLKCPVCFADAGTEAPDPPFDMLVEQMRALRPRVEGAVLQFSGGEPTVRPDLLRLVEAARELEFRALQLNTNGLALAEDPDGARRLRDAGLGWVFLQCDGLSERSSRVLRGRDLREFRLRAVEACARAELGVVLVPTLVRGVNEGELGDLVRFARERFPVVRGVHIQPLSFFGRYALPPEDHRRVTLPEIMALLEEQTGGLVRREHFQPSGCEHARCSFRGTYRVEGTTGLVPLGNAPCRCGSRSAEEGARRAMESVRRRWGAPLGDPGEKTSSRGAEDDLDRFLRLGGRETFSVSAMAFQDAWNLDLRRLRECCIHVAAPEGRLVPFCAWNLTAVDGTPLHRRRRG